MSVQEAKSLIERSIDLNWTDRRGSAVSALVYVYEVKFVPFYGPCLVTERGEIPLDRIVTPALPQAA
jgi:hypothetical protein